MRAQRITTPIGSIKSGTPTSIFTIFIIQPIQRTNVVISQVHSGEQARSLYYGPLPLPHTFIMTDTTKIDADELTIEVESDGESNVSLRSGDGGTGTGTGTDVNCDAPSAVPLSPSERIDELEDQLHWAGELGRELMEKNEDMSVELELVRGKLEGNAEVAELRRELTSIKAGHRQKEERYREQLDEAECVERQLAEDLEEAKREAAMYAKALREVRQELTILQDEAGICGGRGGGLNDGGQMHGGQAWSSPQRKEGGVGASGEEGDHTPGGRIVRRQSDRTISRLETERADLIAQIRNEREKTRAVKTRLQESRKHMQVSDECTRCVFTSLLVVLRTRT